MTIAAHRRGLYPRDWKQISRSIRERSSGRCECPGDCGRGPMHLCEGEHNTGRCIERNGKDAVYQRGTIVLTVAHLDHDPGNNDPSNLRAMCQACHLSYDRARHALTRAETRDLRDGQTAIPVVLS